MSKKWIIFVGGVHGVGKTFWCKKTSDILNVEHYSASVLIKNIKNAEFLKNKQVEDIDSNQDALVSAIDRYIDADATFLLDGHFCLLGTGMCVTSIPEDVFISIAPIAIIVLVDEPDNIYNRRSELYELGMHSAKIDEFQKQEIQHAHAIANSLQVPMLLGNPFTEGEIIMKFIRKFITE